MHEPAAGLARPGSGLRLAPAPRPGGAGRLPPAFDNGCDLLRPRAPGVILAIRARAFGQPAGERVAIGQGRQPCR